MVIDYRVDSPPTAPVTLSAASAAVPIGGTLRSGPVGQWRTLTVPLGCFAKGGADMSKLSVPVSITTSGRLTLTISDVRVLSATVAQDQCGAP
jgi:beta-glucosidase